jgi:hypothetical protein
MSTSAPTLPVQVPVHLALQSARMGLDIQTLKHAQQQHKSAAATTGGSVAGAVVGAIILGLVVSVFVKK